ncbi:MULTISPECIES: MarR family transcriptional regulator [unclassified Pseudovibrio]|uniref:MarR family transcriptional regulator n=1 Tax=unclassified Pseudovibrio TaxID=2627060 RepID=UPI0007B24C75|nr:MULTISPECIES: MarR family transcriptional regulator [unclassified Pseudovibrio]KZK92439.1 hypothetical protein PsW74_05722 [Pseudovibrio sp. W74]KZL06203.1 hypothetical protein PsAD14_04650 [Pseudovibrio sp. Ad14]
MKNLLAVIEFMETQCDALNLGHLACLLVIQANEGLSVQELADKRETHQSTISRQLKTLCTPTNRFYRKVMGPIEVEATFSSGTVAFVEQRINPEAPKKRALYLTEDGCAFLQKLNEILKGDQYEQENF